MRRKHASRKAPGYDIKYAQASAEGAEVYTQSETNLERAVAIVVWGTVGLLAGGAGFANSDMFEQMAADIIASAARHIAQRENDQIWRKVLKWANACGHISKSAINACIEYQTESAAVIERKAKAAKTLVEVGYSQEEAQRRVGLKKSAMPEAATVPLLSPDAREEETPEPSYSQTLAAAMNEHGDAACPHGKHPYCARCGVVERFEHIEGKPRATWHATRSAK